MSLNIELILIGISLISSAFFSASEIALASLTRIKVTHMISEKPDKTKHLNLWLKHPNKLLNTILIGNNISNIFASVLAANVVNGLIGSNQIAITTGIMTFLILFFSEITPKTFAKHNYEKFSLFTIKILLLFYVLFYPISYTINIFATGLIKLIGGDVSTMQPLITENELEFIIDAGEKEGILEDKTKEMIHNIMEIKDMNVKEIMVPRNDITAIKATATKDELLKIIKETEYSRIPVYDNEIDNIIGIIYVKDLVAKRILKDNEINIQTILRKAYFVPETKNIYSLFKEFQKNRIHMAIVVDEYGSVAGIVTLEDILEEIVGEIRDEYDVEEEEDFIVVDKNKFLVNAKINLHDFFKQVGLKDDFENSHEYDTLGGLVFYLAGNIPNIGESFVYKNISLKVLSKEENRIIKLEVEIINGNENNNEHKT